MRLEGTIDVAASADAVWDALLDPLELAACVPGVRSIRRLDERTFEAEISLAVGPMTGEFAFTASIVEASFPDTLIVRAEGSDSVTRSPVSVEVRASVSDTGPGGSRLRYDASTVVKGRLAILGEMVLRATASLVVTQVARCLRDRLESDGAAAGQVP